jgi:hypothetical protein
MPKTGGARPQAQNHASVALQIKFKQGMALHQQGKLADAERFYREVLRQQQTTLMRCICSESLPPKHGERSEQLNCSGRRSG